MHAEQKQWVLRLNIMKISCSVYRWTILLVLLFGFASSAGAEEKPWPFQPPTRPQVPAVGNHHWPQNPIDLFLLARLEAENPRWLQVVRFNADSRAATPLLPRRHTAQPWVARWPQFPPRGSRPEHPGPKVANLRLYVLPHADALGRSPLLMSVGSSYPTLGGSPVD